LRKSEGGLLFVIEKLLIGYSGALLQKYVLENFDRSTFIRSIDFGQNSIDQVLQNFQIFQAIPHEFCNSSLIDLQNIKTQKLPKASENNKAKGLTNVNQGVQIYNIWHSSPWHAMAFLGLWATKACHGRPWWVPWLALVGAMACLGGHHGMP
jgi:hypothetical protein